MNKAPDHPRRALGKGLSALLPSRGGVPSPPSRSGDVPDVPRAGAPAFVPAGAIRPNPVQPRTTFDAQKIQELADSIRANGMIQPLIVRRQGENYELVAGERRLRAAKLAQMTEVPVLIQDLADEKLLEIALVENIQREDLNPIETAQAFDRLTRDLNLSHEEIGRRTGKDRSTVTNLLRLLKLPTDVQILLAEHRLSMGHARAILGLTTPELQSELANKAAAQGYSVRQVERLVNNAAVRKPESGKQETPEDPNVKAALRQLEDFLGTRVRLVESTPQRGRIEIEYYSQDDLNRLYGLILGDAQ